MQICYPPLKDQVSLETWYIMKMIFSRKKIKETKYDFQLTFLFLNTQRPYFTCGTYANPAGHAPQHFI